MSLEFVLLPATYELVLDAKRIAKKIQESSLVPVMVRVDSNFKSKISDKIKKWQNKDTGVILVTNSPHIHVHFVNQLYSQKMSVDEFIELISSFSSTDANTSEKTETNNQEATQPSSCIVC